MPLFSHLGVIRREEKLIFGHHCRPHISIWCYIFYIIQIGFVATFVDNIVIWKILVKNFPFIPWRFPWIVRIHLFVRIIFRFTCRKWFFIRFCNGRFLQVHIIEPPSKLLSNINCFWLIKGILSKKYFYRFIVHALSKAKKAQARIKNREIVD